MSEAKSEANAPAANSDEVLLLRVAMHRDRDSFRLLFEHYDKAPFAVAHYLTSNEAQAADVVQDAMLSVWLNAEQFDPASGAARTWIPRIVANAALFGKRKWRQEKIREQAVAVHSSDTVPARLAEDVERNELTAALRQKVQELGKRIEISSFAAADSLEPPALSILADGDLQYYARLPADAGRIAGVRARNKCQAGLLTIVALPIQPSALSIP